MSDAEEQQTESFTRSELLRNDGVIEVVHAKGANDCKHFKKEIRNRGNWPEHWKEEAGNRADMKGAHFEVLFV